MDKKKILLTGVTGYIGKRLLPVLINRGYHVACCVRDAARFKPPSLFSSRIDVIEVDFLEENTLCRIPKGIAGAYYLIHSMSSSTNYGELEKHAATNFRSAMNERAVTHVVYLSGIVNAKALSRHLASRKAVEDTLAKGDYHFTTLRAGIIVGSGSASFEIIRDLVEKLPIMITPKWLRTKCQPIGIKDVISFLELTLFNSETYEKNFDIGGEEILSYKEMLLGYARARGLKRSIFIVPVMTPKLSSYWLYFVTSTSYKLATALVSSMKVNVVCRDGTLARLLGIRPLSYRKSLELTLMKVEENQVVSSWKDSFISGRFDHQLSEFLHVPSHGCFIDKRSKAVIDREQSLDKVWSIGGGNGWYYATWLWQLRGFIDKLFGGVGLRRGRTDASSTTPGDAIDFWRVLYANREEGRLLLFAEMKLPGEAWLEFKMKNDVLVQTATFRPKGLWGRLYWYAMAPLHHSIFNGMISRLSA